MFAVSPVPKRRAHTHSDSSYYQISGSSGEPDTTSMKLAMTYPNSHSTRVIPVQACHVQEQASWTAWTAWTGASSCSRMLIDKW
ncbi:uncharacterized protein TRAVEDRAFT_50344 [Trametes versicolor FP-101664 SS1]|uniref:uncharacterized protein n=1 Tax=Trametes versicolor (strain FP-101664) TaxID=717944 RepID=UPI0004621F9F|nr:uncharacterized protein TRAVEDRAFT_50344 [Trametes versicolor FP-101664 SS1]EIW55862.1 hypothetical protein TRAVEDRAFT_50344 [Trametes versicolor FP-101664 SS1]